MALADRLRGFSRAKRILLLGLLQCGGAFWARGSWLSDITGIDINVPRGTVTFGAPRPDRIPQMIQNLPKDAAQFFLNPVGGALAFEIRRAKEQARRNGCSPIPPNVVNQLRPFFPPDVFTSVCGALVANGFSLDTWVIKDGGMAAITLEDITVFRDNDGFNDPILWAHELTHALQYRRLGVEGFAAIYAGAWDSLEQEARNFDQFVTARLQASESNIQAWQVQPGWNGSSYSINQYSAAARQMINPNTCFYAATATRSEIDAKLSDPNVDDLTKRIALQTIQGGGVIVLQVNHCPIPIVVTSIVTRNHQTGQIVESPCPSGSDSCFVGAQRDQPFGINPPWDFQEFRITWR